MIRSSEDRSIARLATMVKSRDDGAKVELMDSAYWMKGCSSLGLLRYAVLLEVEDKDNDSSELCIMDCQGGRRVGRSHFEHRHAHGSRVPRRRGRLARISPLLGERMRASTLLGHPVFIRELMPQDLKLELTQLNFTEAIRAAEFLATVVGFAHARQMDSGTRVAWQEELNRHRTRELDAPLWLWTAVVGLLVEHERSYLEHCRLYAVSDAAS